MIAPITRDHLEAVNRHATSRIGLLNRSEYCRFMAATAVTESEKKLWMISAERRAKEAETAA
jgi:hypothetical protein